MVPSWPLVNIVQSIPNFAEISAEILYKPNNN